MRQNSKECRNMWYILDKKEKSYYRNLLAGRRRERTEKGENATNNAAVIGQITITQGKVVKPIQTIRHNKSQGRWWI